MRDTNTPRRPSLIGFSFFFPLYFSSFSVYTSFRPIRFTVIGSPPCTYDAASPSDHTKPSSSPPPDKVHTLITIMSHEWFETRVFNLVVVVVVVAVVVVITTKMTSGE